ncbi:Werner syndrome ATP-dependent helicase-like [Papaver somniferum]|uniref:Werner syndrome ATP-dependent helicase-like n=1 Tax=Papaver somniferum TaxID=3469 RepID=UPI000E6F6305|nr:Werner syndrome ATP-dependent helicase-like [Papaver somniferum]
MTNQQVSIRTLPNFYPDTQDVYTVTVTGFERYNHGAKQIKTVVTKDAATISRCYQLPKSLHRFLEDDNLRFVRLDIECVARKLEKKFNLDVKRAVDLRDLVAENYPRKEKEVKSLDLMGLDKIVLRSKEIERPRDVIVSNWNQKYLTQSQIMYAVVDAYVTFKIGDGLNFTYHYSTPSVLD